jgi:methylated-DNA-protein-cysteine methyltransferase-like protein
MSESGNFYHRVYEIVRRIPRGRVATYRQVAIMARSPRAAQAVGWALRALPDAHDVPWQRVINAEGMISIENLRAPKALQIRLLREEGVAVGEADGNYFVELERYQWRPERKGHIERRAATIEIEGP